MHANQVSKTAPTGEFLSTGSFMIRGKKNFLPPCHLVLGLGFLFKLEESSVERHRGERKVRQLENDAVNVENDQEIALGDSDSEDEAISSKIEKKLEIIDEDINEFPDTHIKIEHTTGKIDILNDSKTETISLGGNQEEQTIIFAGPMRTKKVEVRFKPLKKQKNQQQQSSVEMKKETDKPDNNAPKRGQKGKLKKIKEKYKDQDEQEKAMMMELLQSSGSKSVQKSKNQNEAGIENDSKRNVPKNPQIKEKNIDDVEEIFASDEVDMLETLTGCPVDEDELLFVIPVVAPYQTLTSYKYTCVLKFKFL